MTENHIAFTGQLRTICPKISGEQPRTICHGLSVNVNQKIGGRTNDANHSKKGQIKYANPSLRHLR